MTASKHSGPCEWCGRPGKVEPVSYRWAKGYFEKPTLCAVCVALLDLTGGGFADGDDKRQWAQDQVNAELARHWQAKQGTTSPGASS